MRHFELDIVVKEGAKHADSNLNEQRQPVVNVQMQAAYIRCIWEVYAVIYFEDDRCSIPKIQHFIKAAFNGCVRFGVILKQHRN